MSGANWAVTTLVSWGFTAALWFSAALRQKEKTAGQISDAPQNVRLYGVIAWLGFLMLLDIVACAALDAVYNIGDWRAQRDVEPYFWAVIYLGIALAPVTLAVYLLFAAQTNDAADPAVPGHPRNRPINRGDELDADASGQRSMYDYRPPPYVAELATGGKQMTPTKQGSVGAGIGWMFLISLLLFWLPVIGPFIAGLVGGKKSGGVGNAIVAVFLPGIVFGVLLFVLAASLTGIPILGAIAGVGGITLALVHIGPLLIGAIIGGLIA